MKIVGIKIIAQKKLLKAIENNFIKFGAEALETPSFEISENIGSFLAEDCEICNIIADTLTKCGLSEKQFKVGISNRKIVQGLINQLKINDKTQELKVIRAIDKLDRIGLKEVEDLLKKERVDAQEQLQKVQTYLYTQSSEILNFLKLKNLEDLKSILKNSLSVEGINETKIF